MSGQVIHRRAGAAVLADRGAIAAAYADRRVALQPAGELAPGKARQDAESHLPFLAQALALGSPELFADYAGWAKVMTRQRKIPAAELEIYLKCFANTLLERLPVELGSLAAGFVESAVSAMPGMPEDLPTFFHDDAPLSPLAH